MTEDNRLAVIRISVEFLRDEHIMELSKGMTEEHMVEVIRLSMDGRRLPCRQVIELAKGMTEDSRIKIIRLAISRNFMSGIEIVELAEDMTEEHILQVIEISSKKLHHKQIVRLAKSMEEANRLKVIMLGRDNLWDEDIIQLSRDMQESDKLKIILTLETLEPHTIVTLAKGMTEEHRLEIIVKIGMQKLFGIHIIELAANMTEENRLEVIRVGAEKLYGQIIAQLADNMSSQNKREVLKLCIEKDVKPIFDVFVKLNVLYNDLPERFKEDCPQFLPQPMREIFINGEIGLRTAQENTIENEVQFIKMFGELYDVDKSGINTILPDKMEKLNKKHIKIFMKLLEEKGVTEGKRAAIALNVYCTVGFFRGREILEDKYGEISAAQIEQIFSNVNLDELSLDTQGMPEINEEVLNLALGQNHKVAPESSPLKRYLSIDASDNVISFFKNFGTICGKWDIIKEEIDRKRTISKLEVPRNVETVLQVLKTINAQNIVPEIAADYKLQKTDVANYAGIDIQYTRRPEEALGRAVQLSRMQEKCKTKKFPNVIVETDGFVCSTYSPQDRGIISAGYKSGCCFRPNGNADGFGENDERSLLHYCLTSEYAGGIKIESLNKKTGEVDFVMFSPILRNGNMLMIHSIETLERSSQMLIKINEILEQYAEKVLKTSRDVEGEQAIQAVLVTDLYDNVILSRSKAVLTERFTLHSEAAPGVYTNLEDTSHHVLAKNEGITEDDLKPGDVNHSYEFAEENLRIEIASYSKEERDFIEEYEKSKKEIIRLSNQRRDMIKEGRAIEADECLTQIKSLRRGQDKLRKKSKTGIKALDSQREMKAKMNCVLEKLGIEGKTAGEIEEIFGQIAISEEYIIAVTANKEVIYMSTEKGREEMKRYLRQVVDFQGGDKVKILTYEEYKSSKEKGQPKKEKQRTIRNIAIGGGSYECP